MTDTPDTTQPPASHEATAGAAAAQPTESWATIALVAVLAAALIVTGGGLGGMLVYKFTSKDHNFAAVDDNSASREADIDDYRFTSKDHNFAAVDDNSASHEADIDDRFAAVDKRFVSLEADIDDYKFASNDHNFAAVDDDFPSHEADIDDRFAAVDKRFVSLEADIDDRFASLEADIAELDDRIHEIDLKLVGLVAALNAREARGRRARWAVADAGPRGRRRTRRAVARHRPHRHATPSRPHGFEGRCGDWLGSCRRNRRAVRFNT